MIRNAPTSGQAQAVHGHSGNVAMARSSDSLSSGLDHLFNLGNDPLALFRDTTASTEVLEDENMCQSEGSGTDDLDDSLDRQAVEQELRRYEEDGLVNIKSSLVAFWEVGMAVLSMRHFPLTWALL